MESTSQCRLLSRKRNLTPPRSLCAKVKNKLKSCKCAEPLLPGQYCSRVASLLPLAGMNRDDAASLDRDDESPLSISASALVGSFWPVANIRIRARLGYTTFHSCILSASVLLRDLICTCATCGNYRVSF